LNMLLSGASDIYFNGGAYPGAGGNCGSTLAPSSNCTIEIYFVPGTIGSFNTTLNATYNDGVSTANTTLDFSGTGVPEAVLAISDAIPFDYGNVVMGGTASHTFTISTTGGYEAGGITLSGLALPFDQVSTDCSSSLF